MTFVAGAFLAGTAAASIPVIIHLFHKSRFKIVKWGAMHLLEAVLRTNQRRVKMEQWLLMLIRCAIPAILAVMMARPIWLGASRLLGNAKSSTVVLLDNSYSMDASRAGTTSFALAREAARKVVGNLVSDSEAHVILMGQGGGGLLDGPTYDLSRITEALAKTSATYGSARVPAALEFAAGVLPGMHESLREVIMLTDFQRVSFEATEGKRLAAAVERLRGQTLPPNIVFWDAGQDVRENVSIESLDFSRLMVGVGQKIQIRANVHNYGEANHPDLRVTLKVDGKDKAASQVNLGPQSKAQVLFTHVFEAPGSHVVEVSTEPDVLAADNSMMASIPVRDKIPALLVDGAPAAGSDSMKSETAYLAIALSPFAAGKVELSDLLDPRAVPIEGLNAKALSEVQVVTLANVRKLSDEQTRMLEDFVRTGGGLLIFPGDKTDTGWWNGPFSKLAPMAIGGMGGELKDGAPSVGIVGERFENPALELFNDPRNGTMGEGAIKVWYKFRSAEAASGRDELTILARLDSGDPFLVEKPLGNGKVIACATAVDADWSNLPARPFYLPLMQRLTVYLASNVYPPRNLELGRNLVTFLPADTAGKKSVVTGPDGLAVELPVVGKGGRGVAEFGPVRVPGLYTLVPPGGEPIHYVFNADRRESDLGRLTTSEVNELAGGLGVDLVRSSEEYAALDSKRRYGTELWKYVMLALLGFLFLELILQRAFARSRGRLGVGQGSAGESARRREMEVVR